MAVIIEILSIEQVLERRAAALASTGLDLATLHERAESWQLSPEQRADFEEYEELGWFLDED